MPSTKLRSIGRVTLAIIAGYVATLLLAVATTAILQLFVPEAITQHPPAWYEVFDLGYSVGYMAIGGFTAAMIGRSTRASTVLAAIFLALGVMGAISGMDPVHSAPYQWAAALLGPAAILAGGQIMLQRSQAQT